MHIRVDYAVLEMYKLTLYNKDKVSPFFFSFESWKCNKQKQTEGLTVILKAQDVISLNKLQSDIWRNFCIRISFIYNMTNNTQETKCKTFKCYSIKQLKGSFIITGILHTYMTRSKVQSICFQENTKGPLQTCFKTIIICVWYGFSTKKLNCLVTILKMTFIPYITSKVVNARCFLLHCKVYCQCLCNGGFRFPHHSFKLNTEPGLASN